MNYKVAVSIIVVVMVLILAFCLLFSKKIKKWIQRGIMKNRDPSSLEKKDDSKQKTNTDQLRSPTWRLGMKALKEEMMRYKPKTSKKLSHNIQMKLGANLKSGNTLQIVEDSQPPTTERQTLRLEEDIRLDTKENQVHMSLNRNSEPNISQHDLSSFNDNSIHENEFHIEYKKKFEDKSEFKSSARE